MFSALLALNACALPPAPTITPAPIRATPVFIQTSTSTITPTRIEPTQTIISTLQSTSKWTPAACLDDLEVVLELGDGQSEVIPFEVVPVGTYLSRGWQVQNTGDCTWDSSYTLRFEVPNNPTWVNLTAPKPLDYLIRPGEMADFWVQAQAPLNPGQAQANWALKNGKGVTVGDPLVLLVETVGIPTTTAEPTAWINAVPDTVQPGSQVAISWSVKDAREAYFYRVGQAWQEHPVETTASRYEYPERTTTYELRIVRGDDSVEVRRVTVTVENFDPPRILAFLIEPKKNVVEGQCVDIIWETANRVNRIAILVKDDIVWTGQLDDGALRYCPEAGENVITLIVIGPGGEDRSTQILQVGDL